MLAVEDRVQREGLVVHVVAEKLMAKSHARLTPAMKFRNALISFKIMRIRGGYLSRET
jgi:hypothetical protein